MLLKNDGAKKEREFIDYINNNCGNYNSNIENFLHFIYPHYDSNGTTVAIKCKSTQRGNVKPDILITHEGVLAYISMKTGDGDEAHQEKSDQFFAFIRDKYGSEIERYFRLYHFGDGTLDGTGSSRLGADECKSQYSMQIRQINEMVNEWTQLEQFLNRFIFEGNTGGPKVDYVYYGTYEKGCWASREELLDYFKKKNFDKKGIHFGSLNYQPWGRNPNFTARHPGRRFISQIKWGMVKTDLQRIRKQNR